MGDHPTLPRTILRASVIRSILSRRESDTITTEAVMALPKQRRGGKDHNNCREKSVTSECRSPLPQDNRTVDTGFEEGSRRSIRYDQPPRRLR